MQVYLSHDGMVYSLSLAWKDVSEPMKKESGEIRILLFLRLRIDPLYDWRWVWHDCRCGLFFHVPCASLKLMSVVHALQILGGLIDVHVDVVACSADD